MNNPAETPTGGQRLPERQSRARQRQKLIEACISALYLHGPSRTTIDKVVAIADMSPGIVNFYFDTKAALLMAALEHLACEFEERVLAPLDVLRENPSHALESLIELYLDPDIASPRKVSVWYAFWGEASSRAEYSAICGKRDEAFADLVRQLIGDLIRATGTSHLDADAVALGLIGALEMMWQEIAFRDEADIDRPACQRRCLAYLQSVFPTQFAKPGTAAPRVQTPPTQNQLHEAAKMLVAAELNLAGTPSVVVPSAGCDIVALKPNQPPQRIVVQIAQTDLVPYAREPFEWLAIVHLSVPRRIFLTPQGATPGSAHENNFRLENKN